MILSIESTIGIDPILIFKNSTTRVGIVLVMWANWIIAIAPYQTNTMWQEVWLGIQYGVVLNLCSESLTVSKTCKRYIGKAIQFGFRCRRWSPCLEHLCHTGSKTLFWFPIETKVVWSPFVCWPRLVNKTPRPVQCYLCYNMWVKENIWNHTKFLWVYF